ncbi:MAG: CotH kinase family protein [Bacteroidaceae bacterium]|nr:CotH kinase family protein [Bacteroidaceae bacterium]
MKRILSVVLFLALTIHATNAQNEISPLIINEVMQSNIDCIMDDLNEFPDSWVELYNNGDTTINLQDYKLGIKGDSPFQLPNYTIASHGLVVIFCDKSDDPIGLHTNFRLDSGKGAVYLFMGNKIVDQIALAKQPAPNIAYGRVTDGSDDWGYQAIATPGLTNCGSVCTDILGKPIFSEKGRVMTSAGSISLTLSLPEESPEGTVIRYTTDGSEPTTSSTLYQSAINITSNKVIRAKLFCDGYLSPISSAQSYIFLGRDMKFSVISIVTDDRYLNSNDIGIIKNNPNKNNKHDWRRPINFEFFDAANTESAINQLSETRVAGGQSREHPLKSLVVYANKRFGQKRLNYEFFPDQKPGLTDFKSIMLRNAGNDFSYLFLRDAIIQRVMGQHADLDWQAWRPAIIFINGTYKGMLNIRERSNDDNIYTNYDGLEDIDMIEIAQENGQIVEELKTGTWDRYNAFKAFYHESGHTLAEYAEQMDWKEYINLMVMNLYYGNLDFPGNNLVVWVPTENGSKWRYIAKDTDFGLGLYNRSANYNTIEWINNPNYDSGNAWANTEEGTKLFHSLMEDDDFKREFIDHCAIYMGDFMNSRGTHLIWDSMEELIKDELLLHRRLYNGSRYSMNSINSEINKVSNWLNSRTDYFYTHLANYYNVGIPTPLIINKTVTEQCNTIVNGIELKYKGSENNQPYFDGKFFAGRLLTVRGKAGEHRKVVGWNMKLTDSNNQVTTTQIDGSTYTFEMPTCNELELTAIFANYLRGDVNLDGFVNVTDVTKLVDIILGKNESFDIVDADINGDDQVDVTDVTTLVDIILGKNQ